MKEVTNLQGEKEQVTINTPVKTVNGIHYLLTAEDEAELRAKQIAWAADSKKRKVAQRKANIQSAMRAEADDLAFEVLAGEIDKQVWLDKRAEIKQRFPKEE